MLSSLNSTKDCCPKSGDTMYEFTDVVVYVGGPEDDWGGLEYEIAIPQITFNTEALLHVDFSRHTISVHSPYVQETHCLPSTWEVVCPTT